MLSMRSRQRAMKSAVIKRMNPAQATSSTPESHSALSSSASNAARSLKRVWSIARVVSPAPAALSRPSASGRLETTQTISAG
jgi:hypothetical protein